MAKKQSFILYGGGILLVLLFIALIGVGAYAFIGGGSIGTPSGPQKYWYECDVTIDDSNLIIGEPKLETIQCLNTGKKCGGLFSIFSESGNVQLYDSTGKIAGKSYDFLQGGSQQVTLRGCSDGDNLKIRLYNEAGNKIDEKNG